MEVRLNKYIAESGFASRRKAEEYIEQGRVLINGKVVTNFATKVNPYSDEVMVDDVKLKIKDTEIILVQGNYANLPEIFKKEKLGKTNGLLLDLGFSSDQLEKSGRGFSFLREEPLDMRYSAYQEIKNSPYERSPEGRQKSKIKNKDYFVFSGG